MDVLALRAIHLLDLGHEVHLAGVASLDLENAVRVQGTFSQRLASFHMRAVFDKQA